MDEKSDNLSTLRDYSLDNTQQHVSTCESHTQHFVIIEFCSLLRRVLDVLHHPCVTLLHVIIKAMKIDDKSQSSKILKNRKLPFHTAEFWLYRTFSFFLLSRSVILKDVTYSIMSELLQFMYQGEVNVKQSELQAFMSIAETLQIKGLATNSNSANMSNSQHVNQTKTPDSINSSFNQFHHNNSGNSNLSTNNGRNHNQAHYGHAAGESGSHHAENHRQNTSTPSSVASSVDNGSMKGKWRVCNFCCQNYVNWQLIKFTVCTGKLLDDPTTAANHFGQKRTVAFDPMNFGERQLKVKRTMNDTTTSDTDMNESIDNMNSDDIFNSHVMQPQVTINESPRFDVNAVKRESNDNSSLLQSQSPSQNFRTSHYREWKKEPQKRCESFFRFFLILSYFFSFFSFTYIL